MKIDKIEMFKVPPRWLFLKITTDDGFVGWGEPVIEGKADTVKGAVMEMSDYIIGRDPRFVEDIWQILYRGGFYRGGPILMSAISGIEQALWDIKGKVLGVPVYELLGGAVRDKMKLYTWVGGDKPHNVVEYTRQQMNLGYRAIKMNGTADMEWIETPTKIKHALDRITSLREEFGWDLGIAIDFHGRVHRSVAKIMVRELEPLKPLFIEEPVLPENSEVFPMLQNLTSIPIATGERNYTRWGFKQLFEDRAIDIAQPDLSHAGGIWEVRKIAAMAEAYDVAVAPHCPLGPIAFAACIQLDFCTPNCIIQESSLGIHYNDGADLHSYLKDPDIFKVEDGYLIRPDGVGLGVELNEEKILEESKKGHDWKNPIWRNFDGTVTEW